MTVPLWAVGIVLAGAAPFLARAVGDALEARAKRRAERLVERARSHRP